MHLFVAAHLLLDDTQATGTDPLHRDAMHVTREMHVMCVVDLRRRAGTRTAALGAGHGLARRRRAGSTTSERHHRAGHRSLHADGHPHTTADAAHVQSRHAHVRALVVVLVHTAGLVLALTRVRTHAVVLVLTPTRPAPRVAAPAAARVPSSPAKSVRPVVTTSVTLAPAPALALLDIPSQRGKNRFQFKRPNVTTACVLTMLKWVN